MRFNYFLKIFSHRNLKISHQSPLKSILSRNISTNLSFSDSNGYTLKSSYQDISVPDMTLDQFIWNSVQKYSDNVAYLCSDSGRNYNYSQLRDHSAALAIRLRAKIGLRKGDVIGILMPNVPEYFIALMGIIEAGYTVSMMNPMCTPEEIVKQLQINEAKAVICTSSALVTLKDAMKLGRMTTKTIIVKMNNNEILDNESINFNELIQSDGIDLNSLDKTERQSSDVCVIPFSSGTSGHSKGVMLTHRNLLSEILQFDTKMPYESLLRQATPQYQQTIQSVLPFFHIGGLISMLISARKGCRLVIAPNFYAAQYLNNLLKYKAEILMTPPSIISMLANEDNVKRDHLIRARCILSTGSLVGQSDLMKLLEKSHLSSFVNCYGLTETTGAVITSPNSCTNYSSVGHLFPNNELKIIDIENDDTTGYGLEAGKTGEIWIRSPTTMKGYYKNEKALKEIITEDGWLRSGDMGYYDSNEFIYITDRLKDLIKVKGYQVAPAELEEILRTHPAVAEVAVVGINDVRCGEVPKAFIVLKPIAHDVTEMELEDFVARKVINYKHLKGGVTLLTSLPRSAAGKVLKRLLVN